MKSRGGNFLVFISAAFLFCKCNFSSRDCQKTLWEVLAFCQCNVKESKLINELLEDYDSRVRPVENSSDAILVTVQATMKKLHDVVRFFIFL